MKRALIFILLLFGFAFSINLKAESEEINYSSVNDWLVLKYYKQDQDFNKIYYRAQIKEYLKTLETDKMTEYHRLIFASLACNLDPRNISIDNQEYDLLKIGVFDTKQENLLEKQGLNSLIFSLLALDSMRFPNDEIEDYYTREDIIHEILKKELKAGGFAYIGTVPDPDITSMTLLALSKYQNDLTEYRVYSKRENRIINVRVKDVINTALDTLGSLQGEDGDFSSFGSYNCESTSQVLLALSSLGVDPLLDTRFIKNGNTVLDGLNKYKLEEGKYKRGDNYSEIATRQAEEALLSYNKYLNSQRTYYDLLPEFSETERAKIINLKSEIDAINSTTNLEALYQEYLSIPYRDRFYIYNYNKLEEKLVENGIVLNEEKEYPEVVIKELVIDNYNSAAIEQDLNEIMISKYNKYLYYKELYDILKKDDSLIIDAISLIKDEEIKVARLNKQIKDFLDKTEEDEVEALLIKESYESLKYGGKDYITEDYNEVLKVIGEEKKDLSFYIYLSLIIAFIGLTTTLVFVIIKRRRAKRLWNEEIYCYLPF